MICNSLQQLNSSCFDEISLVHGSGVEGPYLRPECKLSLHTFVPIHEGKDASILHMLSGGNGFPWNDLRSETARVAFDMGCAQERRDLRSMLVWSTDLNAAKRDKINGATS